MKVKGVEGGLLTCDVQTSWSPRSSSRLAGIDFVLPAVQFQVVDCNEDVDVKFEKLKLCQDVDREAGVGNEDDVMRIESRNGWLDAEGLLVEGNFTSCG